MFGFDSYVQPIEQVTQQSRAEAAAAAEEDLHSRVVAWGEGLAAAGFVRKELGPANDGSIVFYYEGPALAEEQQRKLGELLKGASCIPPSNDPKWQEVGDDACARGTVLLACTSSHPPRQVGASMGGARLHLLVVCTANNNPC